MCPFCVSLFIMSAFFFVDALSGFLTEYNIAIVFG